MLLDQEEPIRFVILSVAGSRAAPNYAQAAMEPAITTIGTIGSRYTNEYVAWSIQSIASTAETIRGGVGHGHPENKIQSPESPAEAKEYREIAQR